MSGRFAYTAAMGLVLVLASCQTANRNQIYEGAPRPESEIGVVIVSPMLDVIRVDDDLSYSLFSVAEEKRLEMLPGHHRIVVRFVGSYDDAGIQEELVESGTRTVELDLAAGSQYRLESENPANLSEARAYAQNPTLWIVEGRSGDRIDLERDDEKVFRPTTMLSPSTGSGAVAATSSEAAVATTTGTVTAAAGASAAAPKSLILEELERWWARAGAGDRARFREQICSP